MITQNTNEMSGRINVVLPDDLYEIVKTLADKERRSQSQMAAILIEEALTVRGLLLKDQSPAATAKGKRGKGGEDD